MRRQLNVVNKNLIRSYNNTNNVKANSKTTTLLNAITMTPGTSIKVNSEMNTNPLETNFSTPNTLKTIGTPKRWSSTAMSRANDEEHVAEILANNKKWVEDTKKGGKLSMY